MKIKSIFREQPGNVLTHVHVENYCNYCRIIIVVHRKQQQQQLFYSPLSGTTQVSRYQKKHSPTHHPDHHPVFISFFHLPRSIASSLVPMSMSSLVYLLVWSPTPNIPYISSPNQCLLFATHAHTIATCFAAVSILYQLFLVFLSSPYLGLYLLP